MSLIDAVTILKVNLEYEIKAVILYNIFKQNFRVILLLHFLYVPLVSSKHNLNIYPPILFTDLKVLLKMIRKKKVHAGRSALRSWPGEAMKSQ